MDLFNIDYVLVKDSSFINCTSNTANAQYRANGGAVSIAYFYRDNTNEAIFPILEILGCTFFNNSVFIADPDQLNQALINSIYSGRGGGLSIIVQGTQANVHLQVQDSSFIDNWAQAYGGGLFILVSGEGTYHTFKVDSCNFLGNFGGVDGFGGGMIFSLLLRNMVSERQVRIEVDECYFENNVASAGAGFAVIEVCWRGD